MWVGQGPGIIKLLSTKNVHLGLIAWSEIMELKLVQDIFCGTGTPDSVYPGIPVLKLFDKIKLYPEARLNILHTTWLITGIPAVGIDNMSGYFHIC